MTEQIIHSNIMRRAELIAAIAKELVEWKLAPILGLEIRPATLVAAKLVSDTEKALFQPEDGSNILRDD